MSLNWIFAGMVWLATAAVAPAQPDLGQPTYSSGYSSIMKLGRSIHNFLPSEHKALITTQPISIETDVTPFVRPLFYPNEHRPIRGLWISAGFIDLANNLAHALAIDELEKGYYERYVEILATETGELSLRPLPDLENPRYWTDDVLNLQLSNFNSIVGTLIGINLAHHYLGHFDKYRERLVDEQGNRVPINRLLSREEWKAAVVEGANSAMNAGCMMEGAIPFFEAFERMAKRPAWTEHFLPESADVPRLKKDLTKLQRRFFAQED